MSLRLIYVVRNGKISFFFMAESYSFVCSDHNLFTHSPTDGPSGCFPVLAIVNPAAIDTRVQRSSCFLWIKVKSGTAGLSPNQRLASLYQEHRNVSFLPSRLCSLHRYAFSFYITHRQFSSYLQPLQQT